MTHGHPNLGRRAALAALLAAGCLLPPALSQPPAEPADPLPIKRVSVAPGGVAQEMERLGLTTLERLSPNDFEARLSRARDAARAAPQLVEARYFGAELSGDALAGKGQWKVLYRGTGAAVLPLQPLTVAVRQPRFDTRDALVADFDGQGPGLLIDEPGLHTVTFDWSARREPGADALPFQLGLPTCAVASLELDLPAHLLVVTDGLPVTGPLPADKAELRRWRIPFSGRSPLGLTLRRRPEAGEPRALLAGMLLSRQQLTPDAVEADFTFDRLKVLSGQFRELSCALDPSLRPYEVIAPDLDGWEVRPPAAAGAPATLVVRLREPLLSGSLVVRCFAPLGAGGTGGESAAWAAPWLRLLDAAPGGETLLLHVHPDVALDAWRPGGFRLVEAKSDAGGQSLRLVGGLLEGEGGARPEARVRTRGTDFRARQVTLWKVDPDHSSCTSQVTYEVVRGRLFRLALGLPAGYEVEQVQASPPGLLRGWDAKAGQGKPSLLVDLAQPLTPDTKLRLTVGLRPAAPRAGASSWAFPDLVPLGARLREGSLAIDFDERRFQGLVTPAGLVTRSPPEEEGSRGPPAPHAQFYATYRGDPPRGRLELRPLPPRLGVHAVSSVVLAPDRAAVETTLQLQAEAGTAPWLDVYVSAPAANDWAWRTVAGGNGVTGFARRPERESADCLRVLAARDPLGAAALLAVPFGEWRRLTFRQPLAPPEALTLQAVCGLARSPDGRWQVPLPAVPGAGSADGEVVLHLAGAGLARLDAVGLREAEREGGRPGAAPPWRTFRYGAPPVALALRGPSGEAGRTAAAVLDRAALTTAVESGGRLLHLFRFQAWGWDRPSLPLRLPAGARLLAVKVDGVWVERLPLATEEGGAVRVELPVPESGGRGGVPPRRYEVVYATDGPGAWPWARLESPAPVLPAPPLAFTRRWRLPPGLLPLRDDRALPLPSPVAALDGLPVGTGSAGALAALLRPLTLEGWEARQRQQVAAAARAARPPAGRETALGEALERVACDAAGEPEPLVIDAEALEEAGLSPETALAAPADGDPEAPPFWEALGLVHVPCRSAALLTTRRRRDAWEALGHGAAAVPPSVEAAAAEAAVSGHDTSGRFVWAVAWTRRAAAVPHPADGLPLGRGAAPGWTDWEPPAGTKDDGTLTVVRREPVQAAGAVLAVALAVAWWGMRRQTGRRRLALVLAWLAAAGVGLLWLPASLQPLAWWPLLAGGTVGVAWYLWSVVRRPAPSPAPSSRPSGRGVAVAGALTLLAGAAALVGQAAGPAAPRATVLVVAGPPEAPEGQAVLAPRDLLKQLDALAVANAPRGAAVTAATYEGKAAGDHVEFEARLQVHSFADGPVTLALPFADVRLQDDGLLDGARAFLVAAPAGQAGLLLKIEQPGAHVLVLHFRAAVTVKGPEREVHFRVPRVPQSEATLTVPAGATWFQAPVRQGALTRPEATASRYAVALGRVDAPLLFRWHEEAGPAAAPALRVREAYLWAVRPDAATLSAVLHCTVLRGAPTSLALEVPESLEVQGADVRAAEAGRAAPALAAWRVEPADGKRRLRLDFAAPLTGAVYVLADFVPRRPLPAARAVLPVPAPVGVEAAQGFLAYQADGVEAHVTDLGRLRGPYPRDGGASERKAFGSLWQAARGGAAPSPAGLFALQREPGGDPFLQLRLGVPPPAVRGSQDVAWRVGARQADLRAVARLRPAGDELALVEWEVPGDVTVTRVGGREGRGAVRHWSRSGNRVQAWLDRAPAGGEVELDGWKDLPRDRDGARFDLPDVRLASAGAATTSVRLTAAADVALVPEDTRALLPLGDGHAPERELAYAPRGPDYGGRFHVRPATAGAEAEVLTTVEAVAGQLVFSAHVEYQADRGDGRRLELRLRHWDGEARLDVPPGVRRQPEARRPGGDTSWVLDLPAGSAGAVVLTLNGTRPLPAGSVVPPDVTVTGADRVERWLAVGGPGLATEGERGLSVGPAGPRGGPDLPAAGRAEATRLQAEGGRLWKVEAPDWKLLLRPRRRPAGAAPVRVALTEHTSAVADGRRWLHEAVVWLYHEANTDLDVALPEGARDLGVTVDGLAVTPLQAPAGRLRVPLPGAAGARRVRLRWEFDDGAEPLDRPRLDRPRLPGAAEGPVAWTVLVPAGFTASFAAEEARGRPTSSGPAALDLARAEAQYRLSEFLAEGAGSFPAAALALAQRRFYQFGRYAEAGRLLGGHGAAAAGPRGQGFDEWLQGLRDKDRELARRHNFEELRARAEREATEAPPPAPEPPSAEDVAELVGLAQAPGPRGDGMAERGTPLRWQTGPEAEAPHLLLAPRSEPQARRAAAGSLLLALLLLLVWALAHFPGAVAWVRAFWPEQLALLGCLGWQTYGAAPPLLLLIGVGVLARLLFLARRLLAVLHRLPAAGSTASGMSVEPRPSGT